MVVEVVVWWCGGGGGGVVVAVEVVVDVRWCRLWREISVRRLKAYEGYELIRFSQCMPFDKFPSAVALSISVFQSIW